MKKFAVYFVLTALLLSVLPICGYANETGTVCNVVYFEDCSYMVQELFVVETRASGTKTGSKADTYYKSDGTAEWKVTLTGTFSYTGTSATCTSANVSVTIYNSNWYTISRSSNKSGNVATSSVTMGYKTLGITTSRETSNLTLTCDKNGNLS